MDLLQFIDFSVFYKLKKKEYVVAIDNISLNVKKGEFLVIVGPSGCGKTTLLKSVLGMPKLTDGKILLNGVDIDDTKKQNQNFAFVSQEYSLYPQMTVYDNIAFPLRLMYTNGSEIDRRVKDIAQQLEIDWLLSRKPKQISGGQHQRVAIARALIKNPQIVLFDEPFSSLDAELRLTLCQLVKKIHSEQQPTILYVTHDLGEAFLLADRVVVMNKGEIEQVGTPKEIECNPQSQFVKEFLFK